MAVIGIVKQRRDLTEVRPEDRRVAPTGQRCGVLVSRAYAGGPEQQIDLVQCVHCQQVFPYVRNSGRDRGWCPNCKGITCGRKHCDPCVHWMQMLANMGAGRPWALAKRRRRIMGRVEAEPPKATTRTVAKSDGGILLPG